MAATVGKAGGFYAGGSLLTLISGWSLGGSIGHEEITGFGDDNVKRVPTIRDWNGSANGTLDRSDANQAALLDQFEDGTITAVEVRFATDRGSDYWSGSGIIESFSVDSDVKGKVSVSYSIVAADALSWTEV